MWHGNMMGWGGSGFFGLGHLLWWALLIAGVIVLVRWLMRGGSRSGGDGEDRALSILKERYARGEIDKAEFDRRKRDIT
jgi:putative membrane protein